MLLTLFISFMFYHIFFYLKVNYMLYWDYFQKIEQSYFLHNIESYLSKDFDRKYPGYCEHNFNFYQIYIYIYNIYLNIPFVVFFKTWHFANIKTKSMAKSWQINFNDESYEAISYFWDTFRLDNKKLYPDNLGIFEKWDNLEDKKIKKEKPKKKKKVETNPEIPTIQIGGVSWEYLRLKSKNLKQEEVNWQEGPEFGEPIFTCPRTNIDWVFTKKKKKKGKPNYTLRRFLKLWALEDVFSVEHGSVGRLITLEFLKKYEKLINTPTLNWDLFSIEEKTGRFIEKKITL